MKAVNDKSNELLAATIFWLRQYQDHGLSYSRVLNAFAVHRKDLYFPANVPELPKDYVISSTGDIIYAPCVPNEMRFMWNSRPKHSVLMLPSMEYIKVSNKIDIKWIEWALGTAYFMLRNAGVEWKVPAVQVTIGGFETADFLDL